MLIAYYLFLGTMADVCDILDIDRKVSEVTKESIIGPEKKNKKFGVPKMSKKPEGMTRELFVLLYRGKNDHPPLFPTDTGMWTCCYFF